MSTVPLKIKIKTLASEARHIRHEEGWRYRRAIEPSPTQQTEGAPIAPGSKRVWRRSGRDGIWYKVRRHPRMVCQDLHFRRTVTLRCEARASLIAYGFLRSRQYRHIENNPRWLLDNPDRAQPDWESVFRLINEHGPKIDFADLMNWVHAEPPPSMLATSAAMTFVNPCLTAVMAETLAEA